MINLFFVMLLAISAEVQKPTVSYANDILTLSTLLTDVGAEGALVSPEIDPYILASVAFHENRFHLKGEGDCRINGFGVKKCNSVGPMQISYGATQWPLFAHIHLSRSEIAEPELNVTLAYQTLKYWRNTCQESTIAQTLESYRRGRCAKSHGYHGFSRCELAKAMTKRAGLSNWQCGHERKRGHLFRSTSAVVKKLRI